jgi:hypothetical protein
MQVYLREHTMNLYYRVITDEGLARNQGAIRRYNQFLFGDLSFDDKIVLDIGGGAGLHSFYAAAQGARRVICLEPEAAGSHSNMVTQFHHLAQNLNLSQVELKHQTLQEFEAPSFSFDVIMLLNTINHLDEWACIHLKTKSEAVDRYRQLFTKLSNLAADQAQLVIADCSPHNIFPLLGLKHPARPSIEWHKHQPPEVWARLLSEVGFGRATVRWSSFSRLGRVGWWLFANRPSAFFLTSQFCLRMQKTGTGSA